ncbi:hypothetical protein N7510_011332 [Penicillium lagena]|uniref:uncharacterized protein n=1 Tax=Penicillium lagena TaxID=94218 RepID=UPI002541B70E|nr:uncharacterized protein N7510_011332 [Penicillium lagena]KAJ5601798.1 hypothetical protein N7510_011332 [Penicillium lagena]
MADALSIASGVAGLLSLGIQVTQSLVDFYSSYKNRASDLAKITHNLEDLLAVFRSLHDALQGRQPWTNALELLQDIDKATQRCDEIIKELQLECQRFQKDSATGFRGQIQVAGRRVAYPFRKSTLQKLEEDISEIRENLSLALGVLHLRSNTQIEDGNTQLKSLLERINATQISSTIRGWLMAPDATENHNATCAKRHISTGMWFVKGHSFANWLVQRNSFLWINGFAGCGKSVLCSAAIQHTFRETQHRHNAGIAFFYFSFNDESKQNDSGMLRALLLQLSAQLQDGEKELEQLHTSYKSGTPPVEALLAYFRCVLCRFDDCYILIDAIDESPRGRERERVLRAIETLRGWCLPGLHLLITSRDELDIRRSLNTSSDQNILMKNSEIDKDILNFVSYQLAKSPTLQRWKSRHSEIEARLSTNAQGVFRYVECQFQAIKRARNRNQLDECLRSLPRDLDETYERLLCNIDETYVKDVRRVLTLLCVSTRPLTLNELIDAHAVELNEPSRLDREGRSYVPDELLDVCLGLVEIVAAEDEEGETTSIARIPHFSVQEYLQSNRILQQKAARFAIRSGPANTEVAQICLVYLLELTLAEKLDEAKIRDMPLARFSAMQWHHHYAHSCEEKPHVEELVIRLFQDETNSFVTWIRLFDVDFPWDTTPEFQRPIKNVASPLYYASLLGLESIVNNITAVAVGDGSITDIVNKKGGRLGSALQAASSRGHGKVVQILLDRGADVNAEGGRFGNALQAASYGGHEKVVQMLLNRDADVNAKGDAIFGSALQAAAYSGHEKVVQMLLDVNAEDGSFGSALSAASSRGHEKVVQMLLDRESDVNAKGGTIFGSALWAASSGGHEKVVQVLLDRGTDVNAEGLRLGSALQAASYSGHEKVVQMLLNRGAKKQTPRVDG